MTNGAYACLLKAHTWGEKLDDVIQNAIAVVGRLPKEDRSGPSNLGEFCAFFSLPTRLLCLGHTACNAIQQRSFHE